MTGKYTINCFQYQEDVRCVCVLNDGITSNDEVCADNYNYFWFKLKGKGHSAGMCGYTGAGLWRDARVSQLLHQLSWTSWWNDVMLCNLQTECCSPRLHDVDF